MISAILSPICGRTSSFSFAATAMNSGSVTAASNAARSAATRSAGTPGVVASGRPTVEARAMNSQQRLVCSGRTGRSRISGTFGSSGSFSTPACTSGMICFCGIQVGCDRHVGRIRIGAAAFDLAALHREIDVRAAAIAEDDLEPGAEHVVVEHRILHRRRACAGGADGGDALLGVLERLGLRGVPGDQQLVRKDHIGDPVELAQIGLELRRHAERLVGGEPLADDADHGAVAGRDLRHVVGGDDAAAAGHVHHDHRRIAGDVLAHEAGDQPRIGVVVGGRHGAHDDADLLAAVEIGDRVGRGRAGGRGSSRSTEQHWHSAAPQRPGHRVRSRQSRVVLFCVDY